VVWLKNVNFLGDDQKARSAAVQSALEELSELSTAVSVPVSHFDQCDDLDKRRSFYKALLNAPRYRFLTGSILPKWMGRRSS